ncbi:MAG: hypothetical protein ACI30H_03615 [Paludibacteraceae bacterium]
MATITSKVGKNTTNKKAGKMTTHKRKFSKTWEAAMKLKGSIIVNDPALLL